MDFQNRLLDIGRGLSSEEVTALVFLCAEPLERKAGAPWTAMDLFSRLMDQGRFSAQWPHMLIELLRVIQRGPLARRLELQVDSEVSTPEKSFVSPYRWVGVSFDSWIPREDHVSRTGLGPKNYPCKHRFTNTTVTHCCQDEDLIKLG